METKRTETGAVRATMPCINAHKEFWSEFFELYKSQPVLWDLKHPDYSHRDLKASGYKILEHKLKELYPDANRELVVGKINTYRTSFRKELRKLKEYTKRGIPYTPTLWYFNNLSFLIDQVQQNPLKTGKRKIVKTLEEKKALPIKEVHMQENIKVTQNIPEPPLPTQYLNFEKEYLPEHLPTPPPPKKKPINYHKNNTNQAKANFKPNQQASAEILAKSWAVQYDEMQGEQKLIARKLISDILFHGCLGTLEMFHAIRIQDILHNEPAMNYHHTYYVDSQEAMHQTSEPKIEYLQHEDIDEICSLNSDT